MKTSPLLSALILGLSCVLALGGAGPKEFDVLVTTDPGGKVIFKGKTDGRGNFTTGKLDAGNYVIQFKAESAAAVADARYSIAAAGGKKAVTATAVAGEKFARGGVAMRVQVADGSPLAGQVVKGDLEALEPVQAASRVPKAKSYSAEALRKTQEFSGQGAARPDGVVRPTGR